MGGALLDAGRPSQKHGNGEALTLHSCDASKPDQVWAMGRAGAPLGCEMKGGVRE